MKGRDVIAQSQSGTGKTATFVIGALSRIDLNEKMVQALVLVPTRELACQIEQVFEGIGMGLENLKTHVLVGGRSIDESVSARGLVHTTESVDGVRKSINSIGIVERLSTHD